MPCELFLLVEARAEKEQEFWNNWITLLTGEKPQEQKAQPTLDEYKAFRARNKI